MAAHSHFKTNLISYKFFSNLTGLICGHFKMALLYVPFKSLVKNIYLELETQRNQSWFN